MLVAAIGRAARGVDEEAWCVHVQHPHQGEAGKQQRDARNDDDFWPQLRMGKAYVPSTAAGGTDIGLCGFRLERVLVGEYDESLPVLMSKVIRNLLDPVVAAKVHFTHNVCDLERWIPRENIIERPGGRDAWQYEYVEPSEGDDSATEEDTATRDALLAERRRIADEFLAATRAWLEHAGESAEAAARSA
ncbi:hypothetical protein F4780DRAFT_795127 [Xylariomycetidae sp. FL0641]|nr:hypothetical protein F4780DRAFT_795127 [Xylariomycetidae sp. FL0641]